MKYYTNFIGSLFGLFGGQKIIAVPDAEDIAGIPEIRISILQTIADSEQFMQKIISDPKEKDRIASQRIRTEKIIDYQRRKLQNNGYYGHLVLAELNRIDKEMDSDWWLKELGA